jgi:hypothetical protein
VPSGELVTMVSSVDPPAHTIRANHIADGTSATCSGLTFTRKLWNFSSSGASSSDSKRGHVFGPGHSRVSRACDGEHKTMPRACTLAACLQGAKQHGERGYKAAVRLESELDCVPALQAHRLSAVRQHWAIGSRGNQGMDSYSIAFVPGSCCDI